MGCLIALDGSFFSVGNIMMMAVGQAGKFQNGPRRHFTFKLMNDYSAEAAGSPSNHH